MKINYTGLAEAWFYHHYKPMTLMGYLRCWWYGIDPRRSAVENFGTYLENL